jgi:hypothetical protein
VDGSATSYLLHAAQRKEEKADVGWMIGRKYYKLICCSYPFLMNKF